MAADKRKKDIEQIRKDLFSTEQGKVISALKKARDIGDHTLIRPLLSLLMSQPDEQVRNEIHDMLSTLKISKAERELESALADKQFISVRGAIMGFMWNSGMNPTDSIQAISHAAAEGDFMTALEALTLIENMEGPYEEAGLLESILTIRQAIEDCPDADKLQLLRSMFQILSTAKEAD